MYTLYTTPLSANGRKVLAVTQHLGIESRVRLVNVYRGEGRSPDYLRVNPSGKIPSLVDDGFVLTESNAILQYISEAYGGARLFSQDARERAEITSWMFWEAAHWQPALTAVLSAFVGHKLLPDAVPAPAEVPAWNDETLRPLLTRVDAHLVDRPFLALGELTIADFSLAGMMTYFRAAEFPFDEFLNLASWYGRLEAFPAWRDTQVDLWKHDRE